MITRAVVLKTWGLVSRNLQTQSWCWSCDSWVLGIPKCWFWTSQSWRWCWDDNTNNTTANNRHPRNK